MPLVSKTFSEIITFTRASTATYYNAAGALTSAAINAPRLDYNPDTLAAQGLLIEEARTNSIRNNTMVGAVAGTPGTLPTNWFSTGTGGGITSQIVQIGVVGGVSIIDIRLYGTSTGGNFDIYIDGNGASASNSQSWTQSLYAAIVSGSLTGVTCTFRAVQLDATPANVGSLVGSSFSPTMLLQRFTQTYTTTAPTINTLQPLFRFTCAVGAIDITLRIGLPQLEQGAFATSVIPTTTIALTRAADVASVNTLSPWYNASEGTLFAEGTLVGGTAATFPYQTALVGSNANTDSIGVQWSASAGVMRFGVRAGSTAQADLAGGSAKSANSSYKVAGRYAANNVQAAFDGTLGTLDTTVTVPTIVALSLGGAAGFQPSANTWLRRVTYFPRSLSDAELQSLTT